MAPVASTVELSHVEGVSDAARARELYKYYQPNVPINSDECFPLQSPSSSNDADVDVDPLLAQPSYNVRSDITSSKISSPDTALTAFCQLVSWRLEAQRAMISLIDAGTQYFIAESTKSLDLEDATKHQPGDELWVGCSSVSKAGRLCERTVELAPTQGDEYPVFVVNDLTKDDRFNQLPFVTSPPHLRLYAGVPLITKRGIPIGSLFIVDSRPRRGLTKDDIAFMGTMAKTVMKHLEMVREVEEHRRGMKMSRGLASFVEGRAELAEAEMEVGEAEGTKIVGQFETESSILRNKSKAGSARGSTHSVGGLPTVAEHNEKGFSTTLTTTEESRPGFLDRAPPSLPSRSDIDSVTQFGLTSSATTTPDTDFTNKTETPDDDTTGNSEASVLKLLFSRAANLIREAFEVDGGAVFYDAQKGFNVEAMQSSTAGHSNDASPSESHFSSENYTEYHTPDSVSEASYATDGSQDLRFTRSTTLSLKETEILGFSTPDASSINGDEYPGPHSFVPFEEVSVHNFLRRYPRGRLWTFDSDGSMSSASDEDVSYRQRTRGRSKESARRKSKVSRTLADGKYLSKHFPGVRQLLFVPLWDATRSRWLSACCVWSTEPTRVLSKQNELSFLSAFGNSVMAECSRINTEIADQKKSDFIGSISHELRSPLHGILASAELLDDLNLPNLAQELVETIDSCGRTLLDTINHILDFSKISSLEKNWRRNRRGIAKASPRASTGPLALQQSDLPMINLFAPVDISVLCEEVVESVYAGCVFQNVTAKTFDMVSDIRDKGTDTGKRNSNSSLAMQNASGQHPEVSVILDVDMEDYQFTTQPGAFRRIIMNLLGNALKYTSHGYVKVKLETTELDDLYTPGGRDSTPRAMIVLTVTDTGKGISNEFLRSKLFTPFAQENTLSSGTGLGLSIVRSIINLLEGEITINSEVGRGTQVKVTLPLLRAMPKESAVATTPKSATSLLRDTDESVKLLQAQAKNRTVGLFGFALPNGDPVLEKMGNLLEASIANFLTNWYGFKIVPLSESPDIIIANDVSSSEIMKLFKTLPRSRIKPSILVLCSHSSRSNRSFSEAKINGNVAVVAKPVGPLKLARALRLCLNAHTNVNSIVDNPVLGQPSTNDLSNVFEDLLISPHGGEVLDNSRMATDSDNARKAIESPTPNALVEKAKEFPFPFEGKLSSPRNNTLIEGSSDRSGTSSVPGITSQPASKGTSKSGITTNSLQSPIISGPESPKLLLVDDNMINLKLLRHFITRLGYTTVDEAENGLEAVKRVEERQEGYDIIFMDISMPILDGFGATREIRRIEQSRYGSATKAGNFGGRKATPALVIALTGLAGKNDQEEAKECGIDLFLTKPVAMKEVKKMLENWQSNQK